MSTSMQRQDRQSVNPMPWEDEASHDRDRICRVFHGFKTTRRAMGFLVPEDSSRSGPDVEEASEEEMDVDVEVGAQSQRT